MVRMTKIEGTEADFMDKPAAEDVSTIREDFKRRLADGIDAIGCVLRGKELAIMEQLLLDDSRFEICKRTEKSVVFGAARTARSRFDKVAFAFDDVHGFILGRRRLVR